MTDEYFMQKAIHLAKKGLFTTAPNPPVGCVIVSSSKEIIGEGCHETYGGAHAEINAISQVKNPELLKTSTLYTTLEPCSHEGKTASCAKKIVSLGIPRVVIAHKDTNPIVNGQGIQILKDNGVDVTIGCLADEYFDVCSGFLTKHQLKKPWVRLKIAMSLDAKISLSNGESQWITSLESRQNVHYWRARSGCILTGIGTILHDNPFLNVRYNYKVLKQPRLAILDSSLRISPQASCLSTERPVYIFHHCQDKKKMETLEQNPQITLIEAPLAGELLDLQFCMSYLAKQPINDIFIEGGPQLVGSIIKNDLCDEILSYIAPCFLGSDARSFSPTLELSGLSSRKELHLHAHQKIGPDLLVIYRCLTRISKKPSEHFEANEQVEKK